MFSRAHSLLKSWTRSYWDSFCFVGLVIATLFFCGSVTPSLLPRPYFVQGVLSGFSMAIGYGVGVFAVWFWSFLELPVPKAKIAMRAKEISIAVTSLVFVIYVWRATAWQNSIRERMEMPPVESSDPFWFFLIAIVVACVLVAIARVMIYGGQKLSKGLQRYVPRRIAISLSTTVVLIVALFIGNGVIARGLLNMADRFFFRADLLIDDPIEQPSRAIACGSDASLVDWESIGRRGKDFIAGGPTADEISEFTGEDALEPIRVYVGMRSVDGEESRAELAFEELKRVGAFERKVLIVATPTGTGWLDEGAVDTIEYLHRGDTAIVSAQYSYLPSWITILIDPSRSRRSAAALFDKVYAHWTKLPKQARPRLYLFGLSLGSFGCEDAADLLETFQDPINGAVLSGPPFPSHQWQSIVASRNEDSPIWLPTFRDQSMVRFTSQENTLNAGKPWGKIRNVYIQHASDPMVWFSPSLAWHRPQWLTHPRGPDVSPALRWYPIVTFLQIAFDLPMSTSVPIGYGHNYAPSSYIDAWVAVTQPDRWTDGDLQQLKKRFQPEGVNED
ncbi:alpha/beta hydrolase [Aporhodopirellula aestuarii]|uniref:Alpha/beta-hydrolase family protein n=1 Tax=Aporhodopirellula aestuarii TaxID=2950107 RepID=A0ABT0U5S3_9BACT|nr:alpha/beta-hydrolase family protein [Aporhodopirellula aestuarii]MCM2372152.1 alpha/beta-hydrolase family protein [Aporhodopirellula aestuarii]